MRSRSWSRRADDVLGLDAHPVPRGHAARHDVRDVVDPGEAAVAGGALAGRAPGAVELGAAGERQVPGRDQGHRDRLAPLGHDLFSVEAERHRVCSAAAGEASGGRVLTSFLVYRPHPPVALAQLFRTKSIDAILGEADREGASLRKVLGPWNLVALGIGAIIGTGIFATIGSASAGDAARPGAGPGAHRSRSSSRPSSAASRPSATPSSPRWSRSRAARTPTPTPPWASSSPGSSGGTCFLEYAIGNTAVAISWAGYMVALLDGLGIHFPWWLATDYRSAGKTAGLLDSAPHVLGVPVVFNALAIFIVAAITVVLVWGVKESARFNAVMVGLKLRRPGLLRPRQHALRQGGELASLRPQRLRRHRRRGGHHLLRLHRLRRRLDLRRGVQEPRPRHAHRHPRLARRRAPSSTSSSARPSRAWSRTRTWSPSRRASAPRRWRSR